MRPMLLGLCGWVFIEPPPFLSYWNESEQTDKKQGDMSMGSKFRHIKLKKRLDHRRKKQAAKGDRVSQKTEK
jgi:hypothetical protein